MKKQHLSLNGAACPECRQGKLVSLTRTEEFDFDLGDEIVKVRAENVPIEQCDNPACGEELSGSAAAEVRHEALCRAAGLLPPTEIKAIRERFGWSQQRMAALTGFGVMTISRWERGRLLQNRSNNNFLLALRDCPQFRAYLEGLLEAKGDNTHSPSSEAVPSSEQSSEDCPASRNIQAQLKALQAAKPPYTPFFQTAYVVGGTL